MNEHPIACVGQSVVLYRPGNHDAERAPARVLRVVPLDTGENHCALAFDELSLRTGRLVAGQLCGRARFILRPLDGDAAAWKALADQHAADGLPFCWSESEEWMQRVTYGDADADLAQNVPELLGAAIGRTVADDGMPSNLAASIDSLARVLDLNPNATRDERAAAVANAVRQFPPQVVDEVRAFVAALSAALPQVT